MLLANFDRKEHLQHRAVSLRQHGFLVLIAEATWSTSVWRSPGTDLIILHVKYFRRRVIFIQKVQVKVDLEASKKPWRFRWDWIVSDIDFIESNKFRFWWQSYSQPVEVSDLDNGQKTLTPLNSFNSTYLTHEWTKDPCFKHISNNISVISARKYKQRTHFHKDQEPTWRRYLASRGLASGWEAAASREFSSHTADSTCCFEDISQHSSCRL